MKKLLLITLIIMSMFMVNFCGDDATPSDDKQVSSQDDAKNVVEKVDTISKGLINTSGKKSFGTDVPISNASISGPEGGTASYSGNMSTNDSGGFQYNVTITYSNFGSSGLVIDGEIKYSLTTNSSETSFSVSSRIEGNITVSGEHEGTLEIDVTVTIDSSGSASESGTVTVNGQTWTFGASVSADIPVTTQDGARSCMEIINAAVQEKVLGSSEVISAIQAGGTSGSLNVAVNSTVTGGGSALVSGSYTFNMDMTSGDTSATYDVQMFFNQYAIQGNNDVIILNGELLLGYSETVTSGSFDLTSTYDGSIIIDGECSGEEIFNITVHATSTSFAVNGTLAYRDENDELQTFTFSESL